MKKSSIVSALLVPVLTAGVGYTAFSSFEKFAAPEQENLPYFTAAVEKSQGSKWLEEYVSSQPFGDVGGDKNKWRAEKEERTLISDSSLECVQPQLMPSYVADVATRTNGTVTLTAATTQPGMAKSLANAFEARASDCGVSFEREDSDTLTIGDTTSVFFLGDTAISLTFPKNMNDDDRSEIIEQATTRARETLVGSQCVNIDTSAKDNARNIFYTDNNEPTGLFETQTVKTTRDTTTLPTIVDIGINSVDYPNLEKPEAPLPRDFADVPSVEVSRPGALPFPEITKNTFEKNVTYQIADTAGPGCGWGWSLGGKSPVYDASALEKAEKDKKAQALGEVNDSAGQYISGYLNTLGKKVLAQPDIVRWNNYARAVNDAHVQWLNLEQARTDIRPSYDTYVANWNLWATFDARKRFAQDFVNKQKALCDDRENKVRDWERDNSEDKGYRPATCSAINTPDIVNQSKGAEPRFELPDNVTIPNSWAKAGDNADSVQKAAEDDFNSRYADLYNRFVAVDKENREKWDREKSRTSEVVVTTTPETTRRSPVEELLRGRNEPSPVTRTTTVTPTPTERPVREIQP